ncbi:MAG TPA: hypothetical protein VHU83_16250 [Bryobacteraceae bacterium]|jgi:hypothetical protein|nr:hypothetical protein [Bryobacteraceae bacterium]
MSRLVVVIFLAARVLWADAPGAPELWYWHHSYSTSEKAVAASEALINRAVAAGYTGVAFWDSSFSFMSDPFWPAENVARLRKVIDYAASKGLKIMAPVAPFGFANDALQANPNLAEAQRVVGAQFQVDSSGKRLRFVNTFPGLANAGFESGETDWFSTHDAGISVDGAIAHSGRASGVIRNARGNARFRQQIAVTPWRQYHLRLFFKSESFRGLAQLGVLDEAAAAKERLNAPIPASGTHDWTQLDFTFNSQDSTRAWLYTGVWGGNSGTLWLDDIRIEETALVYVVRREGAPVRVYDPGSPKTVFREGADYDTIADPRMTSTRTPFTDLYHEPPPVTVPAGTALRPGQTVAIDFYAVFPIPGLVQVAMCLTDRAVLEWQRRNAQAIREALPRGAAILMQYDEIRQMNSCASCRAKNLSAGDLLDWSMGESIRTYDSVFPGARLYVWSDMFDPYHNARDHYYYVEGDLAGSWKGVPTNVTILNWNLDRLSQSLAWFAGGDRRQPVSHSQIIAGYYDKGDGAAAARTELTQAAGIPGISGLMYTTWGDDYSQMESFAAAANAGWRAYLTSLSRPKLIASGLLQAALLVALGAAIAAIVWVRSGRGAR